MNTSEYVRVVQGSEHTGKGGNRYSNIEVYDHTAEAWRTVRACAERSDADSLCRLLEASMMFAYREGIASKRQQSVAG